MQLKDGDFHGAAAGPEALQAFAQYLAEREKTKRLLIGAACLLFAIAALVVVFAPRDREGLAYGLGGVLVIIALGAIGATRFSIKMPGVAVGSHPAVSASSGSTTSLNAGTDEDYLRAPNATMGNLYSQSSGSPPAKH